MPDLEIIGVFSHRDSAEDRQKPMSVFEVPFLRALVQAYDRNGYDRMLIANAATWPDSIPFAAYIAGITQRVGFMIAHRPGFVAPTMAARMVATIDQLSEGRAAVHIITGANDKEMQADGDFLTKEVRYQRSAEYAEVLRRTWASDAPFDYDGQFYRFRGAFSVVKPFRAAGIPIYWGGQSDASIVHAGASADVYAFGIDSLERIAALIAKARVAAAAAGRKLRFCMSTRLILGPTEDAAWENAQRILEGVVRDSAKVIAQSIALRSEDRYKEIAAREACLDTRLWTAITTATQGTRGATSLVGTAAQVAEALLAYFDLGVDSFLISGFDFRRDPDLFGVELIPRLRSGAAERRRGVATEQVAR